MRFLLSLFFEQVCPILHPFFAVPQTFFGYPFLNYFLVGAFSLKEKSPTITVGSFLVGAFLRKSARLLQWLVFFLFFFVRLQSHSDWATFLTIETTKTTSIRGQVRSVEISAKGSPLSFFTFLP